jgi:hypothetical protein
MKPYHCFALSTLIIISTLSACSAAVSQDYSGFKSTESFSGSTNMPPSETPQTSQPEQTQVNRTINVPTELTEKARQDLAQRMGVSPDGITVVTVIGQEFSTDAFYCRTTKERIAKEDSPQVISGQSILLNASGHRFEYHASDQTVIFCRSLP